MIITDYMDDKDLLNMMKNKSFKIDKELEIKRKQKLLKKEELREYQPVASPSFILHKKNKTDL